MLLYDVLNLKPTSINEKTPNAGYQTGNQKESRPTDTAFDSNNISQKKVKWFSEGSSHSKRYGESKVYKGS